MSARPHLIAPLFAIVCSCSSGTKDMASNEAPVGLSQRLNQQYGYTQDEKGQWKPRTDKRSSFESKGESAYFNNQLKQKEFNTKNYTPKVWEHSSEFDHKPFETGGNSSFSNQDSRFANQPASLPSQEAFKRENFSSEMYHTEQAHESNATNIKKPSDAETDVRRRVFPKPKIVDYEQQRQLSIEQSKSILGR